MTGANGHRRAEQLASCVIVNKRSRAVELKGGLPRQHHLAAFALASLGDGECCGTILDICDVMDGAVACACGANVSMANENEVGRV